MPRNISLRKQFLDAKKAIRWYEIQDRNNPFDLTYVLRIDINRAQPFVLGSILGKTRRGYGGDIKNGEKRTLAEISKNAQNGRRNIRIPVDDASGKNMKLRPLWITNGTFFLDDCYDFDRTGQPITTSYLTGSVVDSTIPLVRTGPSPKLLIDPPAPAFGGPIDIKPKEKGNQPFMANEWLNRGVFLQRLNSNGRVDVDFQQAGHSASYWASRGYYSVISGAGILIDNGVPRTSSSYMAPLSRGGFKPGQWYCTGPVIAANSTRRILYLIMDRTNKNNDGNLVGRGRSWGNMASYLRNEFLGEIGRTGDGSIDHAVAYDGGGSRGLWIRKQGSRFGLMAGFNPPPGTEEWNYRIIPHHICLWT